MTALRQYERDLELSHRLGDASLGLPGVDAFVALVNLHLVPTEAPRALSAELGFARWKPGIAILGTWNVQFEDESTRHVSWKAYAGPKAASVGLDFRANDHMRAAAEPLHAYAYLPEAGAVLTSFPVDRVLRGAARVLDLRRTARDLDGHGAWPDRIMRRRSSRIELLRYKPERRAVLRLDAKLKTPRDGRPQEIAGSCRLGVRVLPPAEAAQILRRRAEAPAGIFPRVVHCQSEHGLIYEEWVEGKPYAADAFGHAEEAARLLEALHQPISGHPARRVDRGGAKELLGRVPGLWEAAEALQGPPAIPASHWIHGDFHPDQWTQTSTGLRLLDADALRPGAPEEDLASWAADRLQAQTSLSLDDALAPSLTGYSERGQALDPKLLGQLTTEQLIQRAAAGLRRLQEGAEQQAWQLIQRAQQLATEAPCT